MERSSRSSQQRQRALRSHRAMCGAPDVRRPKYTSLPPLRIAPGLSAKRRFRITVPPPARTARHTSPCAPRPTRPPSTYNASCRSASVPPPNARVHSTPPRGPPPPPKAGAAAAAAAAPPPSMDGALSVATASPPTPSVRAVPPVGAPGCGSSRPSPDAPDADASRAGAGRSSEWRTTHVPPPPPLLLPVGGPIARTNSTSSNAPPTMSPVAIARGHEAAATTAPPGPAAAAAGGRATAAAGACAAINSTHAGADAIETTLWLLLFAPCRWSHRTGSVPMQHAHSSTTISRGGVRAIVDPTKMCNCLYCPQ
jgi:hypothetical protein